jgi:hypothetical protein
MGLTLSAQQFNENLALQREQIANDTAYKYATLAKSGSGGGTSGGGYYGGATNATLGKQYASTDALTKIQDWIDQGYTPTQINALIYKNAPTFSLAGNLDDLAQTANNMYQNTHFLSGGHNVQ